MSAIVKQFRWNYIVNGVEEKYPNNWTAPENSTQVDVPLELTKNEKILKLAIQAPAGTIININNENDFLIGQFEILEFNCTSVAINNIAIKGKTEAILNEQETQNSINEGIELMDTAITERLQATNSTISLKSPNGAPNVIEDLEITTTIYSGDQVQTAITGNDVTNSGIEREFLTKYTEGYNKYMAGIRGIYDYTATDVNNVKNVIIDLLIERSGNESEGI